MYEASGPVLAAQAAAGPQSFGNADRFQVKICGLRTSEHALVAAEAGATMLGFMFAPSKRQITPAEAAEIIATVRAVAAPAPQFVGLFVNATAQEIAKIVAECQLDSIQLCGDEPVAILAELPAVPVLRSVRLNGAANEQAWLALPAAQVTPLIDAHVAGSYGGTGAIADWGRAATLARQHQVLLAGGLTPENVGVAIAQVQPWGVDVSSGVEVAGQKDSQRIRQFVAQALATSQQGDAR